MAVTKLSVALDERTAARAAGSARRLGMSLSSWLNQAATNALAVEDGLAAVAGWEAEHGAFSAEELATADRVLSRERPARRPRKRAARSKK